jgi:MoaA/NifB/PqqE/SkfB family radical SAM enzyme
MSTIDFSKYEFSQIPFEEIVRVGQRSLLYNDMFCVSWLLGRYCNYRCSYCWPYARSDKKDHRPGSLVRSTIDEIKRQARERGFNSFHFSFSGGEPTLHPEYLEILGHYADDTPNTNYQSVHMTTNLSQSKAWFEKYALATSKLHRVSITASFHKQFAKPEIFREKLQLLQAHDIQVTINMVLSPDRFDLSWDDALFFHEGGVNVTLKPQSDETASKIVPGYTERQLLLLREGLPQREYTKDRLRQKDIQSSRPSATHFERVKRWDHLGQAIPQVMQLELEDKNKKTWYMDQAERLNAFEFNNFKDWICSAGYRSIIIREPDGVIKRGYSCADVPLGTLDGGFELFKEPAPCVSRSCVSSADSKIPKRKSGTNLSLWRSDKVPEDSRV